MKKMKVRVTFTESILGTSPGDSQLLSTWIASNAPTKEKKKEEEDDAIRIETEELKKTTIFPKLEDGTPFLYDYMIRGFFKNACSALRKVPKTESSKITAFKKIIDGLIFVDERRIPLNFEGEMTVLQRPLRGQTAQGERVALAASEECPAGTWCEFTITSLNDSYLKAVIEWLDYGALNGLGQWHNGGHGRFTWTDITNK